VAAVEDTNLVHRGGIDGLRFAREAAHRFLDQGGVLAPHARAKALAVHRAFVERGLSPGGCADLLAACLFTVSIGD
jgi:triphosphoribosyl-dephospho-CoA synthase